MQLQDKVILIVDDDSRNIFALTAVLKSRKLHVVSTPAMKNAFEILRSDKSIGMVLMDIMMPEIDGYNAIAMIKEEEQLKDIPIVAVTAQAMAGDREKCLAAGANDYLPKPVDVDQLLAIINRLM